MKESLKHFFAPEDLEVPTTERCIKQVEELLGINFPAEYKEFMLETNGVEGGIGENSYVAIWHIEEIIDLNNEYDVNKYTPGLLYFASDGGGTAFAFDIRTEEKPLALK